MALGKPRVSFLTPYRWYKEDKEFLPINLRQTVKKYMSGEDGLEVREQVIMYRAVLHVLCIKPVTVSLNKKSLDDIFSKRYKHNDRFESPVFPNGKCISVEMTYEQAKSKTMLPVIDFRLFF